MLLLTTAVIILSAASAHAEDQPKTLTGTDAIKALVGKSVQITPKGGQRSTVMSIYSDGRAFVFEKTTASRWTAKDNELCIFDTADKPENYNCYDVTVTGVLVTLKKPATNSGFTGITNLGFDGAILRDAPPAP